MPLGIWNVAATQRLVSWKANKFGVVGIAVSVVVVDPAREDALLTSVEVFLLYPLFCDAFVLSRVR